MFNCLYHIHDAISYSPSNSALMWKHYYISSQITEYVFKTKKIVYLRAHLTSSKFHGCCIRHLSIYLPNMNIFHKWWHTCGSVTVYIQSTLVVPLTKQSASIQFEEILTWLPLSIIGVRLRIFCWRCWQTSSNRCLICFNMYGALYYTFILVCICISKLRIITILNTAILEQELGIAVKMVIIYRDLYNPNPLRKVIKVASL